MLAGGHRQDQLTRQEPTGEKNTRGAEFPLAERFRMLGQRGVDNRFRRGLGGDPRLLVVRRGCRDGGVFIGVR